MVYPYKCEHCNVSVDIVKPMAKSSTEEFCVICGSKMERKFTPIPFSFGWRLSDESLYVEHAPDELVKNI